MQTEQVTRPALPAMPPGTLDNSATWVVYTAIFEGVNTSDLLRDVPQLKTANKLYAERLLIAYYRRRIAATVVQDGDKWLQWLARELGEARGVHWDTLAAWVLYYVGSTDSSEDDA